jgi:hypothetical protein
VSQAPAATYLLPPALTGRPDISRLMRELEALENDIESQRVRGAAANGYHLPTFSKSLNDFLEQNKLDVTDDQTRMKLSEDLRHLKDQAPIIHLTFASEADPEFLQQLTSWIRTNIHPSALLSVGLQPSLVGGVYVRTPNHVHDFSLRAHLKSKRQIILDALEAMK